ncbi:MAG: hypothetical protein DRO40_10535 [Thermoprotei archaeon]|nr:MAG: hypothetical protein DRO40_10535 [Thermoprotei archaeon]
MSGYGGGYGKGRKGCGRGRGASGQGGYGRGGGGGPPPWAGQGRGRWGGRGFQGPRPRPIQGFPAMSHGVVRIMATTLDNRGLESTISPMFARSPYITIVDIVNGQISNVDSLQNPYAQVPQGAGRLFSQWILSSGAIAVVTSNIGMNASQILQQSGINVHIVPAGTKLMDALKSLGYIK